MTTARAILLEVKRQLGDTNTPYPNEVDALAFLNRALLGIYNYGIYKASSMVRKISDFTTDASGEATVGDGLAKIFGVAIKDENRIIDPLDGIADVLAANQVDKITPWYTSTGNKINLYPADRGVKTITVDYAPSFVKLPNRSAEVPWCPELESVIMSWSLGLIQGKQQGISDIEFATVNGFGNTLSQYFRGRSYGNGLIGCGPW